MNFFRETQKVILKRLCKSYWAVHFLTIKLLIKVKWQAWDVIVDI